MTADTRMALQRLREQLLRAVEAALFSDLGKLYALGEELKAEMGEDA